MNAPEAILTTAILGGVAYAVYLTRKGGQTRATQEVYRVVPASTAPLKRVSFKDALIGGVVGSLLGFAGGELSDGTPPFFPSSSTDYKTPHNASIGTRLMGDLQRDFGLTRNQAAGIVGNLDHESGGFDYLQEITPTVAGSRGGYGYAQWTGPRRRNFEAWAAKNGLAASSYAANYGFLRHELTNTREARVLSRLRRTNSAEDAALVFQNVFQRPGIPHTESRQRRARKYAGGV